MLFSYTYMDVTFDWQWVRSMVATQSSSISIPNRISKFNLPVCHFMWCVYIYLYWFSLFHFAHPLPFFLKPKLLVSIWFRYIEWNGYIDIMIMVDVEKPYQKRTRKKKCSMWKHMKFRFRVINKIAPSEILIRTKKPIKWRENGK